MLCDLERTTAWAPPNALVGHLEAIGFRVLRRQAISESLLFLDTQGGAVFARDGRLVRALGTEQTTWRFGGKGEPWMNAGSLADLQRVAPWLPDESELHPVLNALRTGAVLRLRGLGTRELAVVVERWSFAGTVPPTGRQRVVPPGRGASAAPRDAVKGTGSPVVQLATCWNVEKDDGARQHRAYLSMVLDEHAVAFGLQRGRPAARWDPLTTGLRSIGRLPPGLPAPRLLAVRRSDSLTTVLDKVIRLQGLRLASCFDGIIDDRHPEYVHDARVATRRARFALRVAAAHGDPTARQLSGRLRSIARLLGPVRDLDLLMVRLGDLATTVRPRRAPDAAGCEVAERRLEESVGLLRTPGGKTGWARSGAADGGFGALGRVLRERRAALRGPVPAALRSAATGCLVQQLSGWSAGGVGDRPVERVAGVALHEAAAEVVRSGDAARKRADVPVCDLHRLRLRMKRLRYTAELFAGALPRRRDNRALQAVVSVCATGQTALGDLNDDAVAETELRGALSRLPPAGPDDGTGAPELTARMITALQQGQRRAARAFQKQWPGQRDRLRRALQELPE